MKNKFVVLVALAALLTVVSRGEFPDTPFLERVITISLQEEKLDAALQKIARQAGFTFSYNPAILDQEKQVSQNFVNKTVREILDQLFNGALQYKSRGRYVILMKTDLSLSDREPKLYSGYVVDEATGERLKDVSVYDPVTLSSAVTDSYGYFEIEIAKPSSDLKLAINKQHYTDTVVVVPSESGRLLNIPIRVNTEKIGVMADSVGKKIKRFWKTKVLAARVNMTNIDDTIFRKTQFSVVPFIGTNHVLSGNVINDYSLNLLGGYSMGVRKLEFGGVFNLIRCNVEGVQVAGTFNAVGGDVRAFQFAGVFNANRGKTRGAQFAGVYNFNWGEVGDFAAAGIFNFAGHGSRAVQLAGIGNVTIGEQSSPHLAGLFNFSTGSAASQMAGSYNFAACDMKGWQAAGIVNFAGKNVKGVQLAGIMNFAGKEMRGAQIAGILNYATKVHGAQIGLVNVADSAGGVPIGLLSFVSKGYHKIELSADEVFYANLAFRTGVRQFYNILTIGAKPSTFSDAATFWTFGYGIGCAPKLSRKVFLNVDLTTSQVMQGNVVDAVNLIHKLYLGVDFQLMKKASLTVGATLNAHTTEAEHEGYWDIFTDYRPHIFYDHTYRNDLNMKMWLGGKIGLRFL